MRKLYFRKFDVSLGTTAIVFVHEKVRNLRLRCHLM